MAILRQAPGERALVSSWYRLVGHFGDRMNFCEWFERGETLPSVVADTRLGPYRFERVYEAHEESRAA